jgi:uncharacterized membrane protein SirB2
MTPDFYLAIKTIHISCAIISISSFCLRAILTFKQSAYLQTRWLQILPHINDSILLICAIYLATSINQSPLEHSWLTAKVIALLIYIGLGMIVIRFAKNDRQRIIAFVLALLCFAYIAGVALSHNPSAGLF